MPWNDKDALTPQALNSRSGLVFNVKDPDFGATGDGSTDDTAAIQAAIDAAEAVNGIVYFPFSASSYLCNSQLTIESSITFIGQGGAVIAFPSSLSLAAGTGAIDFVEVVDVAVFGLTLQSEDNTILSFRSCSRVRIAGNKFTQPSGSVAASKCILIADGPNDLVIENLFIHDNLFIPEATAILVNGNATALVDNVIITNNIVDGANQGTGGASHIKVDQQCQNLVITSNVINTRGATDLKNGITVEQASVYVLVSHNVIDGIVSSGIAVTSDGLLACKHVLITDNLIHSRTAGGNGYGILLRPTGGVTFDDIVIKDNLIEGMTVGIRDDVAAGCDNLVIQDNVILNSVSVGIEVRSNDILIKGNVVRGSADAASLHFVTAAATGCEVFDNIFEQTTIGGVIVDGTLTAHTFKRNVGFVTEVNGTATLVNGNTTIVVTHGLALTPDIQDIVVTPIEAWGSMLQFWVDTPTATQFTINANQDPGQDVDFAWTANIQ